MKLARGSLGIALLIFTLISLVIVNVLPNVGGPDSAQAAIPTFLMRTL